MKKNHTEGNWEIDQRTLYRGEEMISDDKGQFIASIINRKTKKETKANSKLIKYAPKMLEALIKLNGGFKSEWGIEGNTQRVCNNIEYWNKIVADVIKKVTE